MRTSEFEPKSDDLLGTPATVWMRRAAMAERLAAGLNSRKDSELLATYAEECYVQASQARAAAPLVGPTAALL